MCTVQLKGGSNFSREEAYADCIESGPAAIVAGGGIGGLAAALGLANKGCRVTVLEQADAFGEIGAGIQVGPNAFHAMDYLGIGDAGRAKAVYIDALIMMDGVTGERVFHGPLDEPFRKYFGNPYAVIHRADLHGAFLDVCRSHEAITLVNKERVIAYENAANRVRVRTEAGHVYEADAAIGADGVRSKIREQLTGGDPLRLSGHVAYRAVLPIESMPEDLRWNAATLWAGPKCHMVHYPLQGWRSFNLVATFVTDIENVGSNEPGQRDEVLAASPILCRKHARSLKFRPSGAVGCLATATRSAIGPMVLSPCWEMPHIRPTNILRKAPAWRWKMRFVWPTNSPMPAATSRQRSRLIRMNAFPAPTGWCCPHASWGGSTMPMVLNVWCEMPGSRAKPRSSSTTACIGSMAETGLQAPDSSVLPPDGSHPDAGATQVDAMEDER